MSAHTKAKFDLHSYSPWKYKSHQEEYQERKSCNSGKLKLYLPCLWWIVRQHHGYSPRDHYQNIQTSYHHAFLTHSLRHQVHISAGSDGPNSEEARGTWRLAIPWQNGGEETSVVDKGSVVIGGGEASNCCLVYSVYCFSLCLSTLFFISILYSVFVFISMLYSIFLYF